MQNLSSLGLPHGSLVKDMGCLGFPALPIALLHLTTQELSGKLLESLFGGETQMRAFSLHGVQSSSVILDSLMHP